MFMDKILQLTSWIESFQALMFADEEVQETTATPALDSLLRRLLKYHKRKLLFNSISLGLLHRSKDYKETIVADKQYVGL